MISNINKNSVETTHQNKSLITNGKTENIYGKYDLNVYNTSTYNDSSSNYITVSSDNSETFSQHSSNSFNNLNITVGQTSVETYNTTLPLEHTNTEKIYTINNKYNINLSQDSNFIATNSSLIVKNDLNEILNKKLNKTIYNTNSIEIKNNSTVNYHKKFR